MNRDDLELPEGAYALVLNPYMDKGNLRVSVFGVSPADDVDEDLEMSLVLLSAAFARLNNEPEFTKELADYAHKLGMLEPKEKAPVKPTVESVTDNVVRVNFGKKDK